MIKRLFNIDLPYRDILKYSAKTLLDSISLFIILENTLTYPQSIWQHIPK